MRALSGPRMASTVGLGLARICRIPGCRRVAVGFEMCDECRAQDLDLERHWREHSRTRAKRMERLNTVALVSLFVFLMSWLAIEACPRMWVAYKLWQLGSN